MSISAGSMSSVSENSGEVNSIISASVVKSSAADDEDAVDMTQSLGMRSRHYNKDITYFQKKNNGVVPKFTQVQINEMRRVAVKKNMQLLKHHELHPIWVRLGMKGKYPKTQDITVCVAKMKQYSVLNLELVALTNDFSNSWVSSS